MPTELRRRKRLTVGLIALVLVASGCGGDSDGDASLDLGAWITTTSTTTTTTTTEATTTTTTAPPRVIGEDDLRGVLLAPGDVPAVASEPDEGLPSTFTVTDPPECGEVLSSEGPGDIRVASAFFEPVGFLSYQSVAQYTPGEVEDLDAFRRGVAGPCSEGFRYVDDGVESFQRFSPLPDPEVGDDALAARIDVQYEIDGRVVDMWAYMVYFVRDGVAVQVQIVTGAITAEGQRGPDISIEEVVDIARVLDQRVQAL